MASLAEAIELRPNSQTGHCDLSIMVLHGIQRGQEKDFTAHRLEPVLNDLEQISRWQLYARKPAKHLGHVAFDTGMTRLGLDNDR